MALKHTTGETLHASSDRLNTPGTYHLMVTAATETPTTRDGKLINNSKFQISVEVLAGTVADQVGKTTDITFFHAGPNGTEFQKKMDQSREDRLWLALGLLPAAALEMQESKLALKKGVALEIDLAAAVGRQFVAAFADMDKENKYLKTGWLEASHVDDAAVAAIPKSADALKLIAPSLRWVNGRPRGVAAAATPPAAPAAAPLPGSSASPAMATSAIPVSAFDDV